ncbi:DUF982 domain-containing protein [Ancylobacter sonchi]|uniref:DUF982 domain-containing protein n=1 Tax=Ancylobacter TaxID=99 RepID=UPI001BD6C0EF|nr:MULTISPECIES: DUF982 domain-containing protein [Ancylobacter]MBS7534830.1 DUF982 domain-containing protein [Ancylobacter sonchi]MCB4770482.1 DUF982 domain-containing protein [Ancylobacter sp. Lp-2]
MSMLITPISVSEDAATRRTFGDVEGAARFLMENWPEAFSSTPLHVSARRVALDALASHVPVEAFRLAFAAAAEEAGILADPPSIGLTIG